MLVLKMHIVACLVTVSMSSESAWRFLSSSSRNRRYRHTLDSLLSTVHDPDTSVCRFERKVEIYTSEDLKMAHHGLFKEVPWTKEERLEIADLHSTQQYHLLGPFLKKKLDSLAVDNEYRRKIAEFYAEHYPPQIVRKLHSNEAKCRIRKALSEAEPDLTTALTVFGESVSKLTKEDQKKFQHYVLQNSRPRNLLEEETQADLATL